MQIDYLIIGQGIAGSVLSYTLMKANQKVLVIDPYTPYSASMAASGVCNPITGRRLVKTWLADDLFPYLHQFYDQLQQELGVKFCYEKEVYRTFDSFKDQNEWSANIASKEWANYSKLEGIDHTVYRKLIHNAFGGWETQGARYIQSEVLIKAYRNYLIEKNSYRKDYLGHNELKIEGNGIKWKDIDARRVIFCEGAYVIANPYFNYLPHRPDKGEWIKIRLKEDLPLENLMKKLVFIIPLGNQEYLVSGTYHKNDLSYEITEKARKELTDKLNKVIKLDYEIIDQRAGIRSATLDRKPYIGLHPVFPQLGLFNGLGTKGLSLAPYFAKHFYEYLEFDQPLIPEVNITRYQNYFGVTKGQFK